MARYTGPVCRLCRRVGEKLYLKGERCISPKCAIERRPNPPGEHGANRRRRISEHGIQRREKKKARSIYGVLERQFRQYFDIASKKSGVTGELLLQFLERRLDNVVFRLGFSESRQQARQLVLHGHFMVNGRKTDIPSYMVVPGQVIAWKETHMQRDFFKALTEDIPRRPVPQWLILDTNTMTGKVSGLPTDDDLVSTIDTRLIVEYYSR